ncbi:PilX N-terminal domain-containing pilus assembly protein [Aestuariibacter salexigens]|uniref:PilX N-terminal domain-containing pilus assembly protein n=1 Tax=Aestuariibacter salexigens TaxID=226010 RepID=UPI000421A990|nr:PilX N-terminal domain-containing pilus assembly protein [Aestuariibacter salexigens]
MKQHGVILAFSLLILLCLTLLGVSAVSNSLMQTKMAHSYERSAAAFDAAEAAITAALFEVTHRDALQRNDTLDPFSEVQQQAIIASADEVQCLKDDKFVQRTVTEQGLRYGDRHVAKGHYQVSPKVHSWSKTALLAERACQGTSSVMGRKSPRCLTYIIRGCGQLNNNNYVIANTLIVTTLASAQGDEL